MTRYGYLGPEGTFTSMALDAWQPAGGGERTAYGSVDAALTALRAGDIDGAMVPIENSVEGGVSATLDALASGDPLVVTGEVLVPITFVLAARPGTTLADLRAVGTHSHGWAQVRGWMGEHLPDAVYVPTLSTAAAAEGLERGPQSYEAAVCAPAAARLPEGRRARRGRQRRDVLDVREVLAHPPAHLGPGVRVGADGAHLLEVHAGTRAQDERDGHEHLADDDQRVTGGERVQRRRDAALDGVLDRHHGCVDVTGAQGRQGGVDRPEGKVLAPLGRIPGVERHLRERAARTEVTEAVQLVRRAGWRHDASLVRSVRRAGRLVPGSSRLAEASACCSSGVSVMLDLPPTMPLA